MFPIDVDVLFLFVDDFEVLVEALDLANGNVFEVNVSGVAEDLREEILLLFVSEDEEFLLVELVFSVFIDPFLEENLVRVAVGLLNKELPEDVDVFNA